MSPFAWILGQCTPEERDAWILNALALGVEPDTILTDEEMATLGIGGIADDLDALDAEEQMWAELNQIHDTPTPEDRPLPYSRDALHKRHN